MLLSRYLDTTLVRMHVFCGNLMVFAENNVRFVLDQLRFRLLTLYRDFSWQQRSGRASAFSLLFSNDPSFFSFLFVLQLAFCLQPKNAQTFRPPSCRCGLSSLSLSLFSFLPLSLSLLLLLLLHLHLGLLLWPSLLESRLWDGKNVGVCPARSPGPRTPLSTRQHGNTRTAAQCRRPAGRRPKEKRRSRKSHFRTATRRNAYLARPTRSSPSTDGQPDPIDVYRRSHRHRIHHGTKNTRD